MVIVSTFYLIELQPPPPCYRASIPYSSLQIKGENLKPIHTSNPDSPKLNSPNRNTEHLSSYSDCPFTCAAGRHLRTTPRNPAPPFKKNPTTKKAMLKLQGYASSTIYGNLDYRLHQGSCGRCRNSRRGEWWGMRKRVGGKARRTALPFAGIWGVAAAGV
jgi:hypothetical protein